ncbi:hypothetical protein V6N13_097921 [Hibiscus sabdariffa]|uniref:Uncharacterized protein n=1 Tax=Hibiscus sabdariffa TaxID=183260 RepID=A0ABR2NV71_9ROSI
MSSRLSDRTSSQAKLHDHHYQVTTKTAASMPSYFTETMTCPLGELATNLSDSELRETAYEIMVAACRSSGGKPLTFISHSERKSERAAATPTFASTPSLQRYLTSTAASKVKKALGLKSSPRRLVSGDSESERVKKAVTIGEMLRVQMGVSEQMDSRVRRALLRVAAAQLGKRIESIVFPLEMLQQLKPSDFPNQVEYEAWLRRHLKLLEAGLLLHPLFPLDKTDTAPQ